MKIIMMGYIVLNNFKNHKIGSIMFEIWKDKLPSNM